MYNFYRWKEFGKYLKTPRRAQRYEEALNLFEKSIKEKQIWNAEFKENYSYGLMNGLEDIYDYLRYSRKPDVDGLEFDKWRSALPDSLFAMNSIPKLYKHWSNHKKDWPEMYEFFEAIRDMPLMIKELKGYIVKGRKPNPEASTAYHAPMAPTAARQQAQNYLEDAVKHFKDDLYRSILNRYENTLKQNVPASSLEIRKIKDPHIRQLLSRFYTFSYNAPELKMGWQADLQKMARADTEGIVQNFLYKNISKLSNIFAKKELVTKYELKHANVHAGHIENQMFFSFSDGSSFDVYSSVVYGYTKWGKMFMKYPTRFTNVKMANGTMMKYPSEEKMIKEF